MKSEGCKEGNQEMSCFPQYPQCQTLPGYRKPSFLPRAHGGLSGDGKPNTGGRCHCPGGLSPCCPAYWPAGASLNSRDTGGFCPSSQKMAITSLSLSASLLPLLECVKCFCKSITFLQSEPPSALGDGGGAPGPPPPGPHAVRICLPPRSLPNASCAPHFPDCAGGWGG